MCLNAPIDIVKARSYDRADRQSIKCAVLVRRCPPSSVPRGNQVRPARMILVRPAQVYRDDAARAVGSVWLCRERAGEALEFHLPPGGECVARLGLGGRRWSQLQQPVREKLVSDVIARARERLERAERGERPPDEAFAGEYPALWEFVSVSTMPNGGKRTRSKLTLFLEGDQWKAALTDPDVEASAFVTADTFLDALRSLETQAQEDTLDWRRWWKGGDRSKKQKRD